MRRRFLRCECDANATTFQNLDANAMRMRICRIAFAFFRKMRKSQCEFISLVKTSSRKSLFTHWPNKSEMLAKLFIPFLMNQNSKQTILERASFLLFFLAENERFKNSSNSAKLSKKEKTLLKRRRVRRWNFLPSKKSQKLGLGKNTFKNRNRRSPISWYFEALHDDAAKILSKHSRQNDSAEIGKWRFWIWRFYDWV